ncbi:O-antigen polysaccharide polymerase Wzy [Pseudomonas sp. MTM4]|uniref:O-antigen polysaccharide polymerase Wzy n=1 Tax=unclassified Pseudomonas TaxID=196821 RepID=UPI0018D20099|nr:MULTISPECIES: O-antigen polysaccharide polymerase Wzy [unclassified Pseudomonas]QXY91343.1 O-antigen polysaccharide polymerase Wzy [Pseudomonas sp. MTM4]
MTIFSVFFVVFVILLAGRFSWRKKLSGIDIYLLLYIYFFAGPFAAQLLGYHVYIGIRFDYLHKALLVLSVAVFAMMLGSWLPTRSERVPDFYSAAGGKKNIFLVLPVFGIVLVVFALVWLYYIGIVQSGMNKTEKILAVGIYHYAVATLVPAALIAYMALTVEVRRNYLVFTICLVLYCFYSLLMGERDFLLLALPIYFWLIRDVFTGLRYPLILFVCFVFLFVLMSGGRSDVFNQGFVSSLLNQGSNLMVMTNVLQYFEEGGELIWGGSYVSAILNLLTAGFVKITESRSVWFSNYVSNGAGAYGFSLEAEAYLNFGIMGVLVVFLLYGYYYAWIEHFAVRRSHLGYLLYYHFLFFGIYAIRGESLVVLKSLAYCLFFYIFASVISSGGRVRLTSRKGEVKATNV